MIHTTFLKVDSRSAHVHYNSLHMSQAAGILHLPLELAEEFHLFPVILIDNKFVAVRIRSAHHIHDNDTSIIFLQTILTATFPLDYEASRK